MRSNGAMSHAGFEVTASVRDGRHTLLLSGELDLAVAAGLEATIRDLCGEGVSGIELDLSQLTFMDSSGLRAVLNAQELCAEHGYDFLVVPGSGQVRRLLELTGTTDVLRLADAPPRTPSPSAEADRTRRVRLIVFISASAWVSPNRSRDRGSRPRPCEQRPSRLSAREISQRGRAGSLSWLRRARPPS